ncbi:MAG: hypothetical protein Q9184_005011 [Pyrenodesmia sp. 2 TL-2023]
MTVTFEEFEADGCPRHKLLEYWEMDNKRMQPWKFHDHFELTPEALQRWWPLQDVHKFCQKHCAIYATVQIAFHRELAEYLWAKWFQPGTPCRFGESFARYVASYLPDSPKTVPELLDAHRYICAQVLLRQVTLNPLDYRPKPKTVDNRAENLYENHENYRLESLFHAIFIVIDTIPPLNSNLTRKRDDREFAAATPVLLVRTGEFNDLTGPIDFAPVESLSEEVDGNPHVRRINMGDAVDFILDLHGRNCDDHSWGD